MNEPKLAKKFDAIYGKGAAKELFRRMGSSPNVRALSSHCPLSALSSVLWAEPPRVCMHAEEKEDP